MGGAEVIGTYVSQFFVVVVLHCMDPANVASCWPVATWADPYVCDVVRLHDRGAYRDEKDALRSRGDLY